MELNFMKGFIGIIGALVASLFGGWDTALVTLLIFMSIDYSSGLIVAAVFKKRPKTETGTLESRAGFMGLFGKGMILLLVIIACIFYLVMHRNLIRYAVVIAYIVNESISIIENTGLMGIPVPKAIIKAIDILKRKEDEKETNKKEGE